MGRSSRSRATAAATAASLALTALAGCAASRPSAGAPAAPAASAAATAGAAGSSAGDAGALLGADDRARLTALCAQRASGATVDGYRIGPEDLLDVRIPDLLDAQAPSPLGAAGASAAAAGGRPAVAGAPVYQQGFRVDAGGDIRVPTIGAIHAAGLTPTELEKEIAQKLVRAGVLDQPQVGILVVEYRSRVAAVVGSVERPGVYPVTNASTTLADLVWVAGGPTRDAGRMVQFTPAASGADGAAATAPSAAAAATRAPSGIPVAAGAAIRMDVDLLLQARGTGDCALNPPARAGDVISLSPAGSVQVAGWVDKPGTIPVTRGLTLSGAIAAAGGELFAADPQNVTVKRTLGPGEERSWTVDLLAIAEGRARDVPLTDGDVVTVPAATAKLVPYGMWTLTKDVIHVGGSIPLF
ncbi:MAG TPA: SLBB domain-containing protein [Burkholderiales bacterium]|nr:SLBB domain-containing protein [Burkholderiales bacterium]